MHRYRYKFIERRWGEEFFETGSLRLGTVHGYRDIVKYGVARGDPSEGEHNIIRNIEGMVALRKDKYEPILSDVINVTHDGETNLSNLSIVVSRRCEDSYIFCTSYIFSEELFLRWCEMGGMNFCYLITDSVGFDRAISNTISSSANYLGNGNVVYTEDPIDYRSPHANLYPGITKSEKEYGWQYENRSFWRARGPCGLLEPWRILVSEAVECCKPFAYIDGSTVNYVQ